MIAARPIVKATIVAAQLPNHVIKTKAIVTGMSSAMAGTLFAAQTTVLVRALMRMMIAVHLGRNKHGEL